MTYDFFEKGEDIFIEGQPYDNMYIVLDGKIEFLVDYDNEDF